MGPNRVKDNGPDVDFRRWTSRTRAAWSLPPVRKRNVPVPMASPTGTNALAHSVLRLETRATGMSIYGPVA